MVAGRKAWDLRVTTKTRETEKTRAKERIEAMKKTSIAIAAFALVLAFGCKNQSGTTAPAPGSTDSTSASSAPTLSPEELGDLGAKIRKNPDDAQKLLSAKGLTQQSFEQQVRQVAQDPEASKRYAAAYKKAA